MDTGDTHMGYADIIAHEAETLPPEKQVEVLDFVAFLKVREMPAELASSVPKTAEELEAFFRSFNVAVSGYKFDRDDANAR
jgi:hypothetical protein